jgi:NitT/TauT family transport system substrate-binding protein
MIRRFYAIPMALTVTALLAAGCASSGGATATAPGVELHDLTIAAVPAADSAGLYIAAQRGLFAAEGLHVKIVPAISSAVVIQDQLDGKYDITDGNYVSYILANAQQHANLQILAAGSIMEPRCQEILIPVGSSIRTISGLRGKRIGVNVLNNIGAVLVGATLRDYGMSLADVHLVPIPFPDMAAALKKHQVDAAWLPEPFITGAEETVGAEPLADLDAGAAQALPIAGYVVTKTWLEKYPKTAAAFRKALVEAQRIADTDPAAVEQAMVAYSGVSATAAAVMAEPEFPLGTDPVLIQRVANLMVQSGLISKPYQVKQMIAAGA